MNTKILFLIICIIFNLNIIFVKSQLPLNQDTAAKDLILKIKGKTTSTPCDYLTCIASGTGQTVSVIKFTDQVSVIIDTDFSVFSDVKSISLPANVYSINILDNLTKLTKLEKLELVSHNNSYDDSALKLPSSLVSISIGSTNIAFGENMFKSKNLQEFLVYDGFNGYQLPSFSSDFPTSDALTIFTTPIIYGSNIPANIATLFPNLSILTLNIVNDKTLTNGYDLPSFTEIPNLTLLSIYFKSGQDFYTWDFPSILTHISPKLTQLSISGVGFTENGNIDFSNYKEGFKFAVSSPANVPIASRCAFISACSSSSCLKFPKSTFLLLQGCSFNLGVLDLQNVVIIDITGNEIEQNLPTSIVYDNLQIARIEGNNFIGQLPEGLCNVPLNLLSLKNNKFNGKILSCFSCHGAAGLENVLFPGNNWEDFTISSPPSNCPTRLLNDTNVIAKTSSSTVITLQGKDFGWSVVNNNKFKIIIPNKLMTVTIDQGVGTNNQLSTKIDSYNYTLNYNYEKPIISSYEYNFDTKIFSLLGSGFDYTQNLNFVTVNNDTSKVFFASKAITSNGKDRIDRGDLSYIFNSIKVGQKFTVNIKVGDQVSDTVEFTFSQDGAGTVDSSDNDTNSDDSTLNSTSKLLISKLVIFVLVFALLSITI